MITFNPSYLIRFPENKKHSWEDLKKIRDKISTLVMQSILDHLMTENQPQVKLKDTQYF